MALDFVSHAISSAVPVPPDDAALVIRLAFLAAVLLFLIGWGIRVAWARKTTSVQEGPPTPPPLPLSFPPPLPGGLPDRILGWLRVPTRHYRLLDLPLIGLVLLIYFGLTAMPGDAAAVPLEKRFTPELLVTSILFQWMLMGMVIAFVRWRIGLVEWLGLRWKEWPLVFAIAPLTVFCVWCLLGLLHFSGWNGWLERSLGIDSMQEAVKLLKESSDPLVIGLMAFAAVIVAPVAEEVVFRGYLYPAAKRFCGTAAAIVFSSLVFAAVHGNVVALIPLFVLAVLLCLIFEVTGSIWACISVHFLFNGATVTIQLLHRYGFFEQPVPR